MAVTIFGGNPSTVPRSLSVVPNSTDTFSRQSFQVPVGILARQLGTSVNLTEIRSLERSMDPRTKPLSEERGEGKAICRLVDPTSKQVVGWLYLWESGRTTPRFIGDIPRSNFVETHSDAATSDPELVEARSSPTLSGSSSGRTTAQARGVRSMQSPTDDDRSCVGNGTKTDR